jgi:hypothetical protein
VRILFDHGTPVPLRQRLTDHHIETAFERGWHTLRNGDLLRIADSETFEVLVTTDRSLRAQQDLSRYRLAVLVLPTTDWRLIRQHTGEVAAAITALRPGEYVELVFRVPDPPDL